MAARNQTLKNVTLIHVSHHGQDSYKLLCNDGEVPSYTTFVAYLRKHYPNNTFRTYARAIALFYDFLIEASAFVTSSESAAPITKEQLVEIIDAWREYLVLGTASENPLVSSVSVLLPRAQVAAKTSNLYHSALKLFLKVSEKVRQENADLQRVGLKVGFFDTQVLYNDLEKFQYVSYHQQGRMVQSSMLPGVLPARKIMCTTGALPPIKLQNDEFDHSTVFPLDLFNQFISNFRTFRDKALYSLYAASGCRASEGLQLLWEDIDLQLHKIALVEPNSRINHRSYCALSARERALLSWKGRATKDTFLIEPFASMFWMYLKDYVENEYVPHGKHSFVFQHLNSKRRGAPYFTSAASSRQEIFSRAKGLINLPETVDGPHSLRRAYVTYLVNYCPTIGGGFGLPIEVVKSMMGQASVKTTAIYAKKDKDLVIAHLEYANQAVFKNGVANLSLNSIKINSLLAQAKALGWVESQVGEHD